MKSKPKAKVFIDASNVFYAQKKMGWLIDWKKLKNYLNLEFKVIQINFYTSIKNKQDKKNFLTFLKKIDFQTITKQLKVIKDIIIDENGKEKEVFIHKGNFDVEITRDTLLDEEKYKTLILFSGDSDFACLKKSWEKTGKKLVIFSSKKNLAWELRLAAEKIYFLEDLKKQIYRRNWDLTIKKKDGINKTLN
jgi:uncharacterized LabA/DUF88 family protein